MSTVHFTLAQIEAFACVCETGNISFASQKLQKSRTTVSELIDSLEINLGYSLFDRSKRPIKLTTEGQQLYTKARLFLHEANLFDQLAMQMPTRLKQTLTICYDCFIPLLFMEQLIDYFEQRHIKLNLLNVERCQAERMLLEEVVDIGIYPAANRIISADFKWYAIGMIELGIYAHKDFFINSKSPLSLSTLASFNQLIPLIEVPNHLKKIIQISDAVQHITNIELLKEQLNQKRGWSFLPTHLFEQPYKEVRRLTTELGDKGVMLCMVVIWKPTANEELTQIIRDIVNCVML
ncbi:hypothetical protein A9G11_01560 [Gilliamella sp. wkB108]|uniref:LysR family transcriptional regulator n=1 Tax=Gilliamella sp. wkB108 TaxID=3120256 RepID=UPI00080E9236|nr:LysR family transcriptional regulator [Gilliamella apicola]OCG26038.1 hypothetical protein A9G11_01560 [Gilliamella apicola]